MPTQADLFVTPKRKKTLRTKLRPGSTPTTYAAVTTNLLKRLSMSDTNDEPTSINITLPDFSQVKLPDSLRECDKKSLLEKMAIQYATTIASESARKKSRHVSYKDIDAQHSNDIKPIDAPIKDDVDSFLNGLFPVSSRLRTASWMGKCYLHHETSSHRP